MMNENSEVETLEFESNVETLEFDSIPEDEIQLCDEDIEIVEEKPYQISPTPRKHKALLATKSRMARRYHPMTARR